VDLPSAEEREEIFRIHLERKVQNTNRLDLRELAQNSQGYTGAEIEQAVKDAVVSTFNKLHEGEDSKAVDARIDGLLSLEVSQDALLNSIRHITPLSVLKKEEIEELRVWSHQRARPASNRSSSRGPRCSRRSRRGTSPYTRPDTAS
jgi:SpoVK/Ycf46/Vps4 family AAA+-type ATPase